VGFNFAPSGWAVCNNQLLPISQNTALFSLLGTFYGGDGKSTFALPGLQDNVAIGQGNGAGLSQRFMGEQGGSANVTLLLSELPQHNHPYKVDLGDAPPNQTTPNGTASLSSSSGTALFSTATNPLVPMSNLALTPVGGGQPHNNCMPFLVMNFVIALTGIFPSRA
jgi:microcystin-dependent protein